MQNNNSQVWNIWAVSCIILVHDTVRLVHGATIPLEGHLSLGVPPLMLS